MNPLTVLCLATAVACSTGQLVAFPGVYSYPGVLGAYPGFFPSVAPITLKAAAPSPITYKAVAPSPITYKTVAPAPLTFKSVIAEPITIKAASPVTYNVAQVHPVAPVTPVQTQFHAQDELGQYSFGYAGGPSSRAETRDAFGIVRGSYSYIDSEGKLQTQNYVADTLGFRVAGTNLPVAPKAPEAPALVGPEPVQDTPEVAAAKVSFRSLLEKAVAAPETPETIYTDVPAEDTPESTAEDTPEATAEVTQEATPEATPESRKKRAVATQAPFSYVSPLRFSYGYTAPLPYSQPLTYSHPLAYSAAFPAVTPYTGVPAVTAFTGVPAVTSYTGVPAATTYVAAPAGVRDATLLKVVHNPGHAVSYRVD